MSIYTYIFIVKLIYTYYDILLQTTNRDSAVLLLLSDLVAERGLHQGDRAGTRL